MSRSIRFTSAVLGLTAILAVVFAVSGEAAILQFWPLDGAADFMQRVTPLFIVALFVERALEVFITAWRGKEEQVRKAMRKTTLGQATPEENTQLIEYKCETQRVAFAAAISVGIVVSAIGIRALALFIYPDQIEALAGWQRWVFTSVDIVVTGAVIGGGADGLHKIVKVFTTFFDSTSAQFEARRPPTVPQP